MNAKVVIVGAGLAGLSCARHLHGAGVDVRILEGADDIGGRVRTDRVDGFLLDRGFQVLLTAYPECQGQLDYDGLKLRPFFSGALVRIGGRFHRVADPWNEPLAAVGGVLAPIGSLGDKLRVAGLRQRLRRTSIEEIFRRPETSTLEFLRAEGFSSQMIDRFFRPFFGGIFLESALATSSRMFEFVFKMFGEGRGTLPAGGMQAIPAQLAATLPPQAIATETRVVERRGRQLVLDSGDTLAADVVVVAADAASADELVPDLPERSWNGTVCFYFAAPVAPVELPVLVLNGDGRGPINNLCVPSQVAPEYAPEGQALISATVVGASRGDGLEAEVRGQLKEWFGGQVDAWRLLRSYRIDRALPAQPPTVLEPPERPVRIESGVYVCGDHRDTASIQGAMVSGRRAAEAVLDDLGSG